MQRYFSQIKEGNTFKIEADDYHHIVNVMRYKIGDNIEVVYKNVVYLSKIINIDKKSVNVIVVEELSENRELSINVTIAQALVKEDKLNYILQKGTELGVTSFIPVSTERSIIKLDNNKASKKISRWQKICKEASEQSKRNIIPKVEGINSIKDLTKLNYDYKILCSVNEKEIIIKNILKDVEEESKVLIVIGPEGGFTDYEEKLLVENGFIRVSLGERVLRTETASLFVMSIINYKLMR